MIEITSLEDLGEGIADKPFVLVYFSRPDCGVCTALKPKVTELVSALPGAVAYYVNLDLFPQAAGVYSIFTIPGIVVFIDGKESIREARYVSAADLQERMDRLYRLRFP